ncbi:uncharacterized protein F4812DRAFT_420834 [Daldinia caldariorum]|uniref:uncharacterized protein n=1 Tax=Daldinia caldariorum TaxID=326644 RepID=UPI00200852E8|nr:uncharacterized protein F4812DRAFT_420834 [Daldinia caldariorum]KAI1469914.1 hypothetical protein F4812DRAFT_420834 [Daldinia caldariorum]
MNGWHLHLPLICVWPSLHAYLLQVRYYHSLILQQQHCIPTNLPNYLLGSTCCLNIPRSCYIQLAPHSILHAAYLGGRNLRQHVCV